MIRAAGITAVLTLTATPAAAQGLSCTFTQLCTPQAACQSHPGLPFTFDVISGALALTTAEGIAFGTPLGNVEPPALSLIFETLPDQTVLLSLSATGEAAMTQHDHLDGGQIRAVSYFGTCEPAS